MARAKNIKVRSSVELARSTGSAVAVAAHRRPGGPQGLQGRAATRNQRRSGRQALRGGQWD